MFIADFDGTDTTCPTCLGGKSVGSAECINCSSARMAEANEEAEREHEAATAPIFAIIPDDPYWDYDEMFRR